VTISSPGSGSTAANAACSAIVPELQATALATPSFAANSVSSDLTNWALLHSVHLSRSPQRYRDDSPKEGRRFYRIQRQP